MREPEKHAQVTYKDLSLRKTEKAADGKTKKLSAPKDTWMEVMQAGFAEYPVAKIQSEAVEFSSVPEEDGPRIAFHNYLMDLCNVTLRKFGECLDEVAKKPPKKRLRPRNSAGPVEEEQSSEHEGLDTLGVDE